MYDIGLNDFEYNQLCRAMINEFIERILTKHCANEILYPFLSISR